MVGINKLFPTLCYQFWGFESLVHEWNSGSNMDGRCEQMKFVLGDPSLFRCDGVGYPQQE